MKLAVISDIHGNLTALDAVAADIAGRGVDRVVHGGDVALIGARPAEVIDRLEELGWTGILGNTDELLWRPDELPGWFGSAGCPNGSPSRTWRSSTPRRQACGARQCPMPATRTCTRPITR